jgi:NADH-quinone oxidoreductase subunit C
MTDGEVDQTIAGAMRELIESAGSSFGMLVLELRAPSLVAVVKRLGAEFGFGLLLDVTAIDYPQRVPRFDVVYHLHSRANNRRIRLKVQAPAHRPSVPTLTALYGSARFLEREVHDMYGIDFDGNADLRPILLYPDFVGHPLRKDYAMELEQPIVPYRK